MYPNHTARVQQRPPQSYKYVEMDSFMSHLPARGPGRPSKARIMEERLERAEWRAARGGDPRPTPSPEPIPRRPRKSFDPWSNKTPRSFSIPQRPVLNTSRSSSSMMAPITYPPRSPEARSHAPVPALLPSPMPSSQGVAAMPPPPAPPPGGVPGNPRMVPILKPLSMPSMKPTYPILRRPYDMKTGWMSALPTRKTSLEVCRYILQRLRQLKAHADGRTLTEVLEKLPDPEKEPKYYEMIRKPTCLSIITERVETFKENTEPPFTKAEPNVPDYPSVAEFHMDMDLMFSNALRYYPISSRAYYDVSTVQRVFQQMARSAAYADHKFTEGAVDYVLLQAAKGSPCAFNSIDFGPAVGTDDNDQVLSRAGQKKDHVYFDSTLYQGRVIHRGDWVHVFNPTDPSLPIVGHVFRIATSPTLAAHQMILSICWYFRPEQTIHPPSMGFWANEVSKSSCVVEHHLEDVTGQCLTMYYARYQRQRPLLHLWDREAPFYLVEHRYSEKVRDDKERDKSERESHFVKIKNWLSCMPEDQRAAESSQVNAYVFSPPEPALPLPPKLLSPLVRGVKGPGSLCKEPTPDPATIPPPVVHQPAANAPTGRRGRYEDARPSSHHHSQQASQQHSAPTILHPAQVFRHVYNTIGIAQLRTLANALQGTMIDYVSLGARYGLQPQILLQFHNILDRATETGNVAGYLGNLLEATAGAQVMGDAPTPNLDLSLGASDDAEGSASAMTAPARPSTRAEHPSLYSAVSMLAVAHPLNETAVSASYHKMPEETRALFMRDPATDKVLWFTGTPRLPVDGPGAADALMEDATPKHSLDYLYHRILAEREGRDRGAAAGRKSVRFAGDVHDGDGDIAMQAPQPTSSANSDLETTLAALAQAVPVETVDAETNRYWEDAARHLAGFLTVEAS